MRELLQAQRVVLGGLRGGERVLDMKYLYRYTNNYNNNNNYNNDIIITILILV